MAAHVDLDRLSPALAVWHRYDPTVRAELFSTCLSSASGVFLIDPISIDAVNFSDMIDGRDVVGVIVTNQNHTRSGPAFSQELKIPLFAHADAAVELEKTEMRALQDGFRLADDLVVSTIEGAAPGEIALHSEADGGTLVFGDALINMGAEGFTFLPSKYCADPKLMRASLRKFLNRRFRRILFAHGTPIVSQAESRFAELLESGR
jgi:glyoxylase-like metal-dependent hydrolase (beta-lactamase superfamily II)